MENRKLIETVSWTLRVALVNKERRLIRHVNSDAEVRIRIMAEF